MLDIYTHDHIHVNQFSAPITTESGTLPSAQRQKHCATWHLDREFLLDQRHKFYVQSMFYMRDAAFIMGKITEQLSRD